jgi:hypothetical protein
MNRLPDSDLSRQEPLPNKSGSHSKPHPIKAEQLSAQQKADGAAQRQSKKEHRARGKSPLKSSTSWDDKHFPKLDHIEQFRSSKEVGTKVSAQQARMLRRAAETDGYELRTDLPARHTGLARPTAWQEKDRWWQQVTEDKGECDLMRETYGIPLGDSAAPRLPERLHERWRESNCGPLYPRSTPGAA